MSTVRRSRKIVLTLRGGGMLGAAIASFSVAYIAGWPELLILASFCAIPPLLGLVAVAVRRPRFTVARSTTPTVLSAGGRATTHLRLRSPVSVHSGSARWSDAMPWGPSTAKWHEFPPIAAGSEITVHYNFVPPRRGIFELGPLVVELGDPFGFARGEFAVGGIHRVVVAPESADLGQGLTGFASDSGSARLFQHHALAGDHDIMTRDYRPGDALGRVHWKSSAHHGELMVREEEKRSHAEAVIVLDTRRSSWRDASRSSSRDRAESNLFEWALSLISSLRDYLVRHRLRVRVVETAVTQLADAGNAESFTESLARVRLSYHDGPPLRLAQAGNTRAGSLFAVLDSPDVDTVEALIEQRAGSGFAAAFLLGPANGTLDEHLSRAGWLVCRVSAGESVVAAWQRMVAGSAAAEQGVTSGILNA